jgi:hypothetical protein
MGVMGVMFTLHTPLPPPSGSILRDVADDLSAVDVITQKLLRYFRSWNLPPNTTKERVG